MPDLCDGREGSLACDGQRLKLAPVVGLEAGGGGGRRQGLGSFLLEGPPDEEEQMGSNILPFSRQTQHLLYVRHRAKHSLIPSILSNPFDDPSKHT